MDKQTEDMIIARAADLYRQWEARPWWRKALGRARSEWRRLRFALRLY
jgi:hypothetical protein